MYYTYDLTVQYPPPYYFALVNPSAENDYEQQTIRFCSRKSLDEIQKDIKESRTDKIQMGDFLVYKETIINIEWVNTDLEIKCPHCMNIFTSRPLDIYKIRIHCPFCEQPFDPSGRFVVHFIAGIPIEGIFYELM